MKIIGDKVKVARQISSMTITDLSSKIDISKQAISQIEHEEIEPKTETLFKIANTLGFPVNFFTTPYYEKLDCFNTFFRALRSTSVLSKNKYNEKTKLLLLIYDFLEEFLDMPALDVPKKQEFFDETVDTELNYDLIASYVRDVWGLGRRPIWNMVDLLEQHGIIMSVLKDESDKIDAFTFVDNKNNTKRFCVKLEKKKNNMKRRNFSIAHELGHIILHSDIQQTDDESISITEQEKQANNFAAAFLLPKDEFNAALKYPKRFEHYLELKSKWHVSIKAMLNRAKELERISQEEYISLIKKYNYYISRFNKDGERLEPLDNDIPLDKPELFETALKTLFRAEIFKDFRDFMEKLSQKGCSINEKILYDIMSLNEGFFDQYKTEPLIINLKK